MQQASNIGERLRELREAAKLTQGEMERRSHKALKQSYVSRWERCQETGAAPTTKDVARFVSVVTEVEGERKKLVKELEPMVLAFRAQRAEARRVKFAERQHDSNSYAGHADAQAFGKSVVDLREAQKLTRTALARRAGMHPNHLAQIEAGRFLPTRRTIHKLVKALHAALVRGEADGVVLASRVDSTSSQPPLAVVDVRPAIGIPLPGVWSKVPGLFYAEEIGALVGTVIPIDEADPPRPMSQTSFVNVGTDSHGKMLIAIYLQKAKAARGRREPVE